MSTRILVGDCRELMAAMDPESVDAIVTDPPYELGFMGRGWDRSGVAFDPDTWRHAFRVLKPGGRLLAFGGTRTYHRMVCAIEDAGFAIEDTIAWLYGSGFPKHKSKLKPAHEPIVVAWKLAKRATVLQIDACRIDGPGWSKQDGDTGAGFKTDKFMGIAGHGEPTQQNGFRESSLGRWPANVVLDEDAAALLDAQSGERAPGNHPANRRGIGFTERHGHTNSGTNGERRPTDSGGASRFFYCAKASRAEREIGMDGVDPQPLCWSAGEQNPGSFQSAGTNKTARNHHPTVKPIALMQWLVRLVTPSGGIVLDPFTGSGSTGIAAHREGFAFVGIELVPEYAEIARRRIAATVRQPALLELVS